MCHICEQREREAKEQDRQNRLAQRQLFIDAGASEHIADEIVDIANAAVEKASESLIAATELTPYKQDAAWLVFMIAGHTFRMAAEQMKADAEIREMLGEVFGESAQIVTIN